MPISIATKNALSVLILSIIISACNNGNGDVTKTTKVKDYPVITVKTVQTVLNAEYPATIQGQQNVEIRPRVDGYIEQIYVDEGSLVKKGQMLFRLDSRQYQQTLRTAEASIKIAEADVSTAQLQVNKTKNLVDKDIVSHFELESAQNVLLSKQAVLAQAKANYLNAKTNMSYTMITSPTNGIVGSIPYKVGSLVSGSSAQPLTTVSNIGNVIAYFSMNEKDFLNFSRNGNLHELQSKLKNMNNVTLKLSDGSIYPIKGKIETVNGLINSSTGSVNFRASFPNPQGLIRSGSSATLVLPTPVNNAILIPQKATYEIQGKKFVYKVGNDKKVISTEITVLPLTLGQLFVVESGLNSGDKIVMEGVNSLKDKRLIKQKYVNVDSVIQSLSNTKY